MPRENRTEVIKVRLSLRELEELQELAAQRGWTSSEAIRAGIAKLVHEDQEHMSSARDAINRITELPSSTMAAIERVVRLPVSTLEAIERASQIPPETLAAIERMTRLPDSTSSQSAALAAAQQAGKAPK